ncbi:MAG: cupin domain-containing protein [Clostridia bacterium]|nr:cupin domain-containing protein [Clostridia bacterium]
MLAKKEQIPQFEELSPMGGAGHLSLDKMSLAVSLPDSVGTLARATLAPGGEVGYHVHTTDSEAYYFLSGVGEYTEDGRTQRVEAGDVTYTPLGKGHGVKNIGNEDLVFIALILNA